MITQVTEGEIIYNHAIGIYFFVVHNSEKIISIIEGTDSTVTDTMQNISEFETLEDAESWITNSCLEYTKEEEDDSIA